MFGGYKSKRLAQFLVLAVVVGEASYAAAQVLVLRSVGPSARRYPAGQRLPDSTSFVLRPGDTVVVLARGGTRTFRGPGTYTATGPVRAGGLASASVRRTTGAVRGPGAADAPLPENVWAIDVTRSGSVCVAADAAPVLWRPTADRAVQLTITPPTGAPRTVTWASGQKTLNWPGEVPLADGASYQLSWTGAAAPTRITARKLAQAPAADLVELATALTSNNCRGQLDVFIAQNEAEEPASGSRGGAGTQ